MTHTFDDDGCIPNSPLPVLIYDGVDAARDPGRARRFAGNGWEGARRDGIFSFHHFHSTAHEVLGIVRGNARVTLGGPRGQTFAVRAGDVMVLPAGTGHCKPAPATTCWWSAPIRTGWSGTSAAATRPSATRCSRAFAPFPLPRCDPVEGPRVRIQPER